MSLLPIAAALLLFIGATLRANAAPSAVPADRWMEVDLYSAQEVELPKTNGQEIGHLLQG